MVISSSKNAMKNYESWRNSVSEHIFIKKYFVKSYNILLISYLNDTLYEGESRCDYFLSLQSTHTCDH